MTAASMCCWQSCSVTLDSATATRVPRHGGWMVGIVSAGRQRYEPTRTRANISSRRRGVRRTYAAAL
jgi:hypothetical protein